MLTFEMHLTFPRILVAGASSDLGGKYQFVKYSGAPGPEIIFLDSLKISTNS